MKSLVFSWRSALIAAMALALAVSHNNAAEGPPLSAGSTNWTAAQDHKNMMQQLGITKLRPGPSGRQGATNSANYDPAKANPFPDLPDPLTLKNGRKVTTP